MAKEGSKEQKRLEQEMKELEKNMKAEEGKLKKKMKDYFTTFIVNPESVGYDNDGKGNEKRKLYLQLQKWISQEFELPEMKDRLENAAQDPNRKAGWLNEPWARDFLDEWVV
eukprot:UN24772